MTVFYLKFSKSISNEKLLLNLSFKIGIIIISIYSLEDSMINDSMMLYKLMILYMLSNVNFPISNSQLSDFFLGAGYTDYSNLQQALVELVNTKLISMESTHNSSRYSINSSGEQTLEYLNNKLSTTITNDIDTFLTNNKLRMRNEASSSASYYKSENGSYIIHFEVREGKEILLGLDLTVPDKEQAARMCDNWDRRNKEIYQFIMLKLISNKDN